MARYAIINEDNKVINVIELEQGADWMPPAHHQVVKSDVAGPGDTYQNGRFIQPAPKPIEPTLREQYTAATTDKARQAIIAKKLGLIDG